MHAKLELRVGTPRRKGVAWVYPQGYQGGVIGGVGIIYQMRVALRQLRSGHERRAEGTLREWKVRRDRSVAYTRMHGSMDGCSEDEDDRLKGKKEAEGGQEYLLSLLVCCIVHDALGVLLGTLLNLKSLHEGVL
ncbi:hypothetical protein BU15DRAFT_59824 [Melanogaster broomeanus]|nr:hypothetical protein BU15DRAFT_59824 [Melanogaster broomeanus]